MYVIRYVKVDSMYVNHTPWGIYNFEGIQFSAYKQCISVGRANV